MKSKLLLTWLIAASCLLLGGCNFDVPIISSPTRVVEPQLLGNWVPADKGNQKPALMKVRQLDNFTYIVSCNGDLFRAYHTDLEGVPYVTVQDLETPGRKFAYFTWQLSADGAQLTVQPVNARAVPQNLPDSSAMRRFLSQNVDNLNLLGEPVVFNRQKPVVRGPASVAPR
jgi:hypothetical protein